MPTYCENNGFHKIDKKNLEKIGWQEKIGKKLKYLLKRVKKGYEHVTTKQIRVKKGDTLASIVCTNRLAVNDSYPILYYGKIPSDKILKSRLKKYHIHLSPDEARSGKLKLGSKNLHQIFPLLIGQSVIIRNRHHIEITDSFQKIGIEKDVMTATKKGIQALNMSNNPSEAYEIEGDENREKGIKNILK